MLGVVSSKGVGRGALRVAVSVQSRGLKRPPVNTSQLEEGRRSGLLAMKVGMLPFYDKWGVRSTVTVLQVDNVFVVQHKKNETEGYDALQLSVGEAKRKNLKGSQLGQYDKVGLVAGRDLQEFRITPDAAIEVGSQLHATHFVPGQLVDVCGTSKGKGFQGVMKRHNFSGGRATHGNSKNHRTPGSTGGAQDPGRTFKGQKMPGRMGGDRKTVQNLKVMKVEPERNLIYVAGAVPGVKGGFVRVTDAVMGPFFPRAPPFPTWQVGMPELEGDDRLAPVGEVDAMKPSS